MDGNEHASVLVDDLSKQAENLCLIHDHSTRIIANLDVKSEWFRGYDEPKRARFDLKAMVLTLIYKYTHEFTQSQLERRLRGAAYVYIRFGLKQPLSQQVISYNERNRFRANERKSLKIVARNIQQLCVEHSISDTGEPSLNPNDLYDQSQQVADQQVTETVERAAKLGFSEFTADRASNYKYELEAFFERQGYLNMARAGTTTPSRRFARLSSRPEVPHGSTHNRTMKKIAAPDPQLSLNDFSTGKRPPDWQRIRDKVLPAFHAGIEVQLDEIAGRDRDGIRQPVVVAIDITHFNFWPSPFKSRDDSLPSVEPVVKNGREIYPKPDYPEMVSGFKEEAERGYKFATCTIVAEDTPIVLGIEPVRDYRWWEREDRETVETTSKGDVVDSLLQQAEQHVDIHKVFCDRGFDSHFVRDAIDQRNIQYVIGKRSFRKSDYQNIEEIEEDPVYDTRIEHTKLTYGGRTHKVSIVYLPGKEYAAMTINGWISPDRAQALTRQYRQRWIIENEYKTIKQHFLPATASKDYRIRFLYFVIGVILYNIWRLVNFVLRDESAVDLGESPPLLAGEIVELVSMFLFDPGGSSS